MISESKVNKFKKHFINTFFEGQYFVEIYNSLNKIHDRTQKRVKGDYNKLFIGRSRSI